MEISLSRKCLNRKIFKVGSRTWYLTSPETTHSHSHKNHFVINLLNILKLSSDIIQRKHKVYFKENSRIWKLWHPLFLLSGYFHPRKGELLLGDIAFQHRRGGGGSKRWQKNCKLFGQNMVWILFLINLFHFGVQKGKLLFVLLFFVIAEHSAELFLIRARHNGAFLGCSYSPRE